MAIYFETRIKYDKMHENGQVKPTTEAYLVDAISFTEAEARITEERAPFITGDFEVSAVKKTKISEVFRSESVDKWYACKLNFESIQPDGSSKKQPELVYVEAETFKDAYDRLLKGMEGTMADWEIVSISETPILEVYENPILK